MRATLLCFLSSLAFSSCTLARAAEVPQIESVSLIQLIANPDRYEGKLVQVTGFVVLEFEGNAIYLHREDFENSLPANGLWLNAAKCNGRGKSFTKGYAIVAGKFTGTRHGHMGLWSGEIYDVQRCDAWFSR
ncbi:MAG: hypothetical protein ABI304_06660 [Rudaea sp.]